MAQRNTDHQPPSATGTGPIELTVHHFQATFDLAPDATFGVNREGLITFANRQVAGVFGYEREELIGRTIEDLMPVRFRKRHHEHMSRFNDRPYDRPMGGVSIDLIALHKDGTEFSAEISLTNVDERMGFLVIAVVRDVTERKLLEQYLADQVGRLDAMVRVGEAMAKPGTFEENVREALGVLTELSGADWAAVRIYDDAKKRWEASIEVSGETNPYDTGPPEHSVIRKAWDLRQVVINNDLNENSRLAKHFGLHSAISIPLMVGDSPFGVITVAARNKDHFGPELTVYLRVVTSTMGPMIESAVLRERIEIERSMKSRADNFISTASHELRTPLTALVGFSELLITRTIDEESKLQFSKMMNDESRRLARIVDDMLDVSRIQSGRLPMVREALDLGETVDGVIANLKALISEHSIVVEKPIVPRLVWGDRDRLQQVLWNLVENANKYSSAGTPIRITVASDEEREMVTVSVADEGQGIPEEKLESVFEPFTRLERDVKDRVRGTGLGLHIVRSILDAHEGSIEVESVLGKGSTFVFEVPFMVDETEFDDGDEKEVA
jgi:PAS domain S-box-containing protein